MSPARCARVLWLLPLFIRFTCAALSNLTIDDEQGDSVTGAQPNYSGAWNYGPTCPGCKVQPDPSQCFDESWHEATVSGPNPPPYINLTFIGTAVYVFAVIPNSNTNDTLTTTNLTFTMNNDLVGTFFRPNTSSAYAYHVPVYVNESMPNDQYTLQIEPQWGTLQSYFAFDYAIYTFDDTPTASSVPSTSTASDPASTQSSSSAQSSTSSTTDPAPSLATNGTSAPKGLSHTGAIVGGVVAGVAAITILALVILCLRRRSPSRDDVASIQRLRRGQDSMIAQGTIIEPFRIQLSQDALATHPLLTSPSASRRSPHVGSATFSSGTEKAAEREQLARQVHEMEQMVAGLSARLAGASSPIRSNTAQTADRRSVDEALRAQVEALRLEVERLKAAQEAATEPPPAY